MQDLENEWVITVLGREISGQALGRVKEILAKHGLSADAGERLSQEAGDAVCHQQNAHGELLDPGGLRAAFLALSDELAVDVAFQKKREFRRERRLFVFDMDSTLIQGEVIDELAKMAGVADQVVAITASAMRGEIEFQESFRRRVALLEGLAEVRAHEVLERIPLM